MAMNPHYKHITTLAKSKVADAALVSAWVAAARTAAKIPDQGARLSCFVALGEMLGAFRAAAGTRGLWGPAWVSIFADGDARCFVGAAELFDYLAADVADEVLGAHVPDLLGAVERGGGMIADVARHGLGVRREIDKAIAKLLETASRIGVPTGERERFDALVVKTAHGWPGLEGGSSFAAYSDLAEAALRRPSPAMLAFPATSGYELQSALFRAKQGEAVVARVVALVGAKPEPATARAPLHALATAVHYLNAPWRKAALAAVEHHAEALLAIAESLVGRRATWAPGDAEHEATTLCVASILTLMRDVPPSREPKRLQRVAALIQRQALELPTTDSSLRPLRGLGAGSIPILVAILRQWLPRIEVKKAVDSTRYSGSSDVAIAYVEASLFELFAHADGSAAKDALVAEARTWGVTEAQVFLTLVSSDAHHHADSGEIEPAWRKRGPIVAVALASLPAAVQKPPATKKLLDRARKLFGDAPLPKLSKKPPVDLDAAFALLDTLGLDRSDVPCGKGLDAAATASLPELLRPLYARANGVGGSEIVKSTQLAALAKRFQRDVRAAIAEEGAPWKRFSAPEDLVPFGKSGSGDVYFLDPARGEVVYRFDHEEQEPAVEHKTIATFVGRIIIERWGELASQEDLAQETFVRWIPG